jgi:hypothetical protein
VVAIQGLGAAIITQAQGTPQFNQWFLYVLLVFIVGTLYGTHVLKPVSVRR